LDCIDQASFSKPENNAKKPLPFVLRSIYDKVCWIGGPTVGQSVSQLVDLLVGLLVGLLVPQSIGWVIGWSVGQSVGQKFKTGK
jgi:hypothetical protein